MKRGELWTIRGNSFASKPRPVLIIQNDSINGFESTVPCLITSYDSSNFPTRIEIEPSERNGLQKRSWIMTDKIYSSRKDELGYKIGTLTDSEMEQVSSSLAKILGLEN